MGLVSDPGDVSVGPNQPGSRRGDRAKRRKLPRTADDIDFDSPLMRLAAGVTASRTDQQSAAAPQPARPAEGDVS